MFKNNPMFDTGWIDDIHKQIDKIRKDDIVKRLRQETNQEEIFKLEEELLTIV